MKIDARLDQHEIHRPDPWDDDWGIQLPLDHVICRDIDGTPHLIREFVWPWTAYTKHQRKFALHFYYWNQKRGQNVLNNIAVSPERQARIRELQFLMTRQIYLGAENSSRTLEEKLRALHHLARFSEKQSCTVHDVLTNTHLLDACGAKMPSSSVKSWMAWINFFRRLDPATQLGFTLAAPKRWKDLERRMRDERDNVRQYPPLPTRIYGALINNLSDELTDIEAHAPRLLAALREAVSEYGRTKANSKITQRTGGPSLIEKYGLHDYLLRRGFSTKNRSIASLSAAVNELFLVCKLQIHMFSGMRRDEAKTLPFHCMVTKRGRHGRTHSLIAGVTTKFNKGRCVRTYWITTEREGFRAVKLAQQFASVIYESVGTVPSSADADKDEYPLFPSTDYFPWSRKNKAREVRMRTASSQLSIFKDSLYARLLPQIEAEDVAELEEIDPFRAWRDEPAFGIGQQWPLNTHQLRRSLAVYANASGLVRLSSLRRQLQHITREMTLYYGRGSTFCKNFIANDPAGYRTHVAPEWQDGEDEAMILTFTREVLNSKEPLFGGAGNFYQRQKERGSVMSYEEVARQMKAGLLSYEAGPLGGCTKPGRCDKRKGLALIDISCATDGCKNLVGKHSKIIRAIQLKRAAMTNITLGSIEDQIEREELAALERVEREWRDLPTPQRA